jgi:hypothetical protein
MPPAINVSGSPGGGKTVATNPVSGLHATARTTEIDVKWSAAKNATSYRVIVETGKTRVQTDEVTTTSTTLHNLKAKTSYSIKVLALPTNSSGYSHEASTTAKTK